VKARNCLGRVAFGKKPDILIVDDDASITEVLLIELHRHFDVRAANSVGEALRAVRCQAPDALVTDLDMDDGGGEHLLSIVKFLQPDVLRVVHSASPFPKLRWVVESGLAHAAVEKWMDLRPLKDTLARLFASRIVQDERAVALGSLPDLARRPPASWAAR
jgi:DNA-binding NtrC family response regulator